MLNPLNFLSKFIKSSNQKELDRIAKIVEKVNSYESTVKDLADEEFPKKTIELNIEYKIIKLEIKKLKIFFFDIVEELI